MAKPIMRRTPTAIPASRAVDSIKAVLAQKVERGWERSHTPSGLIASIEAEIAHWRQADQPAMRLQRIAVLSTMALSLALEKNPNPDLQPAEEVTA